MSDRKQDALKSALKINDTFYKTLLQSTKAIPWRIDWATMQFTYIGPQIQALLGWSTDSWMSANDWAERIHPDDREKVVGFCISQSKDGVDHEMDYRALTIDGDYVWIRDVVHVIRDDNGVTETLVGFMFDINERKKNEEELLRLQKELEALSYQDTLTEIANRRSYNIFLESEWDIAIRNQTQISAILVDIDFFKKYNDSYGHNAGDVALRKIAQILKSEVRSRDLVARLGGEEFIIILPATSQIDAKMIAERIRLRIATTSIKHDASSTYLTASLGVGSILPKLGDNSEYFIEIIDKQLYRAKEEGRNKVIELGC
ncbi:diguanylate cyclase [Acinetobacter sp. P8-3-8]|uniref:GGDEF domain-containing protein n=1 Tax=Acinetobacter sp. P8-3-8 TaxID=1029823 RepID=UPI00024865B1|nr:diguanylate cyclase [Acinetobacter sp. P8-3-8]